jgi:hypothetical protein
MAIWRPFNPQYGANQSVTAAGTSASITIDANSKSVRVVNTGSTNVAHFRIGTGAQTATAADCPILPGASLIVSKAEGQDTLAYISGSGTTLQVQTGEGGD